jgi:hypothetical protein
MPKIFNIIGAITKILKPEMASSDLIQISPSCKGDAGAFAWRNKFTVAPLVKGEADIPHGA